MSTRFDLDEALKGLQGVRDLLVCPHDDPDPDALASAWGMELLLRHELGCDTTLAFNGIIGRAENQAMVRELGIRLRRIENLDVSGFDGLVLVDTQPAAGNHSAPPGLPVLACIDHHPLLPDERMVPWLDIRPDGECTSTIVLSYLNRRGIPLEPPLATAILYALKTDTRDLSREASTRDLEAWRQVSEVADRRVLGAIVHPRLGARYFIELRRALDVATVRGPAVEAFLGELTYPDLVAEIADLLIRRKDLTWCLCGGLFDGALRFSLRTEDPDGRAGERARELAWRFGGSAGGHGMIAGGRLPVEDPDQARQTWDGLIEALVSELRIDDDAVALCPAD